MATEFNKWTRPRSFWEKNGPEIGTIVICVIFLGLAVMGAGVVLFKPEIPGLSQLYKAPPPPPRDPMAQKLTLEPGEQEIILFNKPAKPPAKPQNPTTKP
jgi:hypothetical protein